jgi:hypothetical protein
MSVIIIATPGHAQANSYITEVEADNYFAARLPLTPKWEDAADPTAAIVMATRTMDALMKPIKSYVPGRAGGAGYYRTTRGWAGAPATTTQRLAWPRTGMLDRNGNAIASNVIPQELKDAVAEFAGQLIVTDTTLDNDVSVQGLTSIRAGSVSLSFKDAILPHVIPDAVMNLMPPWWFTDEVIEPAIASMLDVFGQ